MPDENPYESPKHVQLHRQRATSFPWVELAMLLALFAPLAIKAISMVMQHWFGDA